MDLITTWTIKVFKTSQHTLRKTMELFSSSSGRNSQILPRRVTCDLSEETWRSSKVNAMWLMCIIKLISLFNTVTYKISRIKSLNLTLAQLLNIIFIASKNQDIRIFFI